MNDKISEIVNPCEDRLLYEIPLNPEAIISNALGSGHIPISPREERVAVRGRVHPIHTRCSSPYEFNPDGRIPPCHVSREGAGVFVAVASLPVRQRCCSQVVPVRSGTPGLATAVIPTVRLLRRCQFLAAGFPARVRRTEGRVAGQESPTTGAQPDVEALLEAAFVRVAVQREVCAWSSAGANGAAVLGTEVALVDRAIFARVGIGVEARAGIRI